MAKRKKTAPEQEAGVARAARPTMDTNIIFELIIGIAGTLITAFAVIPLKGTKLDYVWGVIRDRGPVQYAELFMAWMVIATLFMKSRIIRSQLRVIADGPVDPNVDLSHDEEVQELRNSVASKDAFSWSILLNRIDRMLALWLGSKDVGRVSDWAGSESDRDQKSSETTYSLSEVLIWAIPIMGFIGTVMGLGSAVSGFAKFLAGTAELSAIKTAITNVTVGLGVAFDTTLLALVLSVLIMLPLSSIQRKEKDLFVEIDNYLDDMLISRFPSAEQQPLVIENLEDSIEAAFRRYIPDPDRYDEVFTRSIERASTVVEERFNSLSDSYTRVLSSLSDQLSSGMGTVSTALEASMAKILDDFHAQEDKLLEARRALSEEEANKFRALMDDFQNTAMKVAEHYRQSAEKFAESTTASSLKTTTAANELTAKLEQVVGMAQGIQDMLHIEESIQKSLSGISASQEFQDTLTTMQKHLQKTDDFCERLSRPRVIVLEEGLES